MNAPGRPTRTTFLLARRSARSIFSGGKLWWSSIEGIESPTLIALTVGIELKIKPRSMLGNIVILIMMEISFSML